MEMKCILVSLPLWLFLVCPFGTFAAEGGERVMTLGELFSLADSSSKTIRIFESAVEVAERDISVARNEFLPEIGFSASASYNGNAWVSERDFSGGQSFESPHFGNSFAVEASQVIFAGGAIYNNVKSMELRKRIAEWDLEEHRQQVYFMLAGYYLDLYKCRNLLKVYERNMEQTRQVIRDMQAREATGIALNNDITRYEVQYRNLEYRRTELASSISICNGRLVTMLDLPDSTEIYPDTAILGRKMPVPDEAVFQERAGSNSPVINRNRLAVDVLSRKEKVLKAGYMPRINIFAGDNLNGPVTYEIPVLNNNINVWYVGVGLKFDIGNLYRTPKEISQVRSSMVRARNELDSSEEEVSLCVRDAYIRYLDSFELLRTQEKSLQLACENYEVVANRYANDLVLVTDLVDADNLRLAAEVQYVNAQINIIYNYYKLLYETGSLDSAVK